MNVPNPMTDKPANVWQFLLIVFNWIGERSTRALGLLQGTLAILAAQDNLLTQKQVSAVLLGTAMLTYWRGSATAKVYANAQSIVKQATTPDVPILPNPTLKEPPPDSAPAGIGVPLSKPQQESPK